MPAPMSPGVLPPLPSVFQPLRLPRGEDALARAVTLAPSHGAGTLTWADDEDVLSAAVVLEPETALEEARPALLAAAHAMADALLVLGPPEIPVTLRWPGILVVNDGVVGKATMAIPADAQSGAVPAWIAVGVHLHLRGDAAEPGHDPGRTVLFEEGFAGIPVPELIATWARHLMAGLAEWQGEGFHRLAEKTLARLEPEDWMEGARLRLDPVTGALLLDREGTSTRHGLEAIAA